MPSDGSYRQTKRIKLGKASIKREFRELAAWIAQTYHVSPLNIIYDTIDDGKRPRIEICVESESDERKLAGRKVNYDSEKQDAIAKEFGRLLREQGHGTSGDRRYITENTFVCYSAFEPVAKIEAVQSIPEEKILDLKKTIGNKDLWKISRMFSATTFFVFTDRQLKKYENSETRKKWADLYFDLLEPYNEFGYFKRNKFSIFLDSKENFDDNYEGNWHYYYH